MALWVTAIGNLGADAEVKTLSGDGGTVTEFRLACNDRRTEETVWVRVSLWGESRAKVADYLTKGKRVAVSGILRVREYETKEGEKRTSVEMRADQLELLGGGESQEERKPNGNLKPTKGEERKSKPRGRYVG